MLESIALCSKAESKTLLATSDVDMGSLYILFEFRPSNSCPLLKGLYLPSGCREFSFVFSEYPNPRTNKLA